MTVIIAIAVGRFLFPGFLLNILFAVLSIRGQKLWLQGLSEL